MPRRGLLGRSANEDQVQVEHSHSHSAGGGWRGQHRTLSEMEWCHDTRRRPAPTKRPPRAGRLQVCREDSEARSRSRGRRRIAFVRSHQDDRKLEYGSANRLTLGGGSRIILVPTRMATTWAKSGRSTRFRPNFTRNSRGWRCCGIGGILGQFWCNCLFLLQPQQS